MAFDLELHAAFAAITRVPDVINGDVGLTAEALVPDLVGPPDGARRRIEIENTSPAGGENIAILFQEAGFDWAADGGALTIDDGRILVPGRNFSMTVGPGVSLGIVADGAGATYTGLLSDYGTLL